MNNLKNFMPVSIMDTDDWKLRAIKATRGNQTFTGVLLLAVLGRAASNAPRIVSAGMIDKSGGVFAFYQHRPEDAARMRKLCEIGEYIDRFRFLSDHILCTDVDREEMFREVKMWIAEDHRPRQEWDYARQQHA